MSSNVANFYKKKNVFITGGSGFLGIAIIEKLLRTCPEIGTIYLLMRPKKGKSINERLADLTKNAIFETLLQTSVKENVFSGLVAVTGDVGEHMLGMSPKDRQTLVENVDVVIHAAATLDFQADLRQTVSINLLGTRRVMDLAVQIKNIKAMVHVSSAYVNAYILEAEEKLYPPLEKEQAQKLIDIVNTLSDEAIEELTPKLLNGHPNTYTLTKHLAEHEVNKCIKKFPCAVVRPSMITAAWKEPIPGWTISKNGPQGFLMGASKGVVRRLPVGTKLIYDYIPVDTVVNEILVTGYHIANKKSDELSIFHCTSSTCNPFKWEGVQDKVNEYLHKYPLKSAVWYPHLKFLPSLWLFKLSAIFIHFLPAYILDTLTKLAGGRPILVRMHTNIGNSLNLLEKFIFTEWKFYNNKTIELSYTLNETDKIMFNIDIRSLKWEDYFVSLTQGVRRYLNNELPKTLDDARKKDKRLMMLHLIMKVVIHCLIWLMFHKLVGTISILVVPISFFLFGLL